MAGRRPQARWCSPKCASSARPRRVTKPEPRGGVRGPRPGARRYSPGDRFGELVLVAYAEPDSSGSRIVCDCDCGNRVELALRNASSGRTTRCPDRTNHADDRSSGDQITTGGWHQRLTRLLGPARDKPCAVCGASGDTQWAYRHNSFNARVQLTGKDRGQVFSTDARDYWALCRRHHHEWDRGHRRVAPPNGAASGLHVLIAEMLDPDALTDDPDSLTDDHD